MNVDGEATGAEPVGEVPLPVRADGRVALHAVAELGEVRAVSDGILMRRLGDRSDWGP